jgi:hypothetical protein
MNLAKIDAELYVHAAKSHLSHYLNEYVEELRGCREELINKNP